MPEIPLPSLETLAKASGWLSRQADIWLQVIKSPKHFISSVDLTAAPELGRSVQFLIFVLICTSILELPVFALKLHLHVFDATTQITNLILMTIEIVLFSSMIFLFGRTMWGKGQYRNTMIAMFYATAFYPLGLIPMYVNDFDTASWIVDPGREPVKAIVSKLVTLVVWIYVAWKVIPLIKVIHSVGAIRALIVIGLSFAVVISYEALVYGPILTELMSEATAK
jgi:hypothetical protein